METAIFKSKSKTDLTLLVELAKKIGIKTFILTKTEIEDMGLAIAMKKDETKEYVNANDFIKKLRKK